MITLFNLNWNIFILLATVIASFLLAAALLKAINIKLSSSINWAKSNVDVEYKDVKNKGYMKLFKVEFSGILSKLSLLDRIRIKMLKAGEIRPFMITLFFFLQYVVPVSIFLLSYLNDGFFIKAVFSALICYLVSEFIYRNEKSKHERIFRYNVYKIYKFLSNQLIAGVKLTDALQNMYKIVDDPFLKNRLFFLSSKNYLSNDIDEAFKELNQSYTIDEANSLYQAIKQGINAGTNQTLFEKKEKSMFNKYVAYIEAETSATRTKAVLAAICFAIVIVLLLAYPMLHDVTRALEIIF
jgi:Flp pilus assembly protein TadB